jgi:hypothetical protein
MAHEVRDDAALVPALGVVLAAVDVFGAESEHTVVSQGQTGALAARRVQKASGLAEVERGDRGRTPEAGASQRPVTER